MTRVACVALVLLLAGALQGDDKPTAEQLMRESFRARGELVKVLDGVKDKEAAEKARPKVDDLRRKLQASEEELRKKPREEQQSAFEAVTDALGRPPDVPAAWERLANRFPVNAGDPLLVEDARGVVAEMKARTLLQACEAYYANPQSRNVYPTGLADLVEPRFGGASFLRNGLADVYDPWGAAYKYEVAPTRGKVNGKDAVYDRPYVWTERKIDGKVRVFGWKPPEKK
jgi:hypothetical protein